MVKIQSPWPLVTEKASGQTWESDFQKSKRYWHRTVKWSGALEIMGRVLVRRVVLQNMKIKIDYSEILIDIFNSFRHVACGVPFYASIDLGLIAEHYCDFLRPSFNWMQSSWTVSWWHPMGSHRHMLLVCIGLDSTCPIETLRHILTL